MARRKIDQELLKGVSERLRIAFGTDKVPQVWERIGKIVTQKSLWDYLSAIIMPGPDVLIAVSRVYNVSLDWLLTGQESFLDQDGDVYYAGLLQQLTRLGIKEEALEYLTIMVERHSRAQQTPEQSIRIQLTDSLGLDTVGKRLRYLRESEMELTLEAMAEEMGISPEKLERIEAGEIQPSVRAIQTLHSRYPELLDKDTLDWLLAK